MRRDLRAIGLLSLTAGLLASGCQDDPAQPSVERPPTSSTAPTATSATDPTTTTTDASAAVDLYALRPPAAPTDPAGLADQIEQAERTLRDASATEVETAQAALAHQVAYRQLGTHPEWDAEVLSRLPAALRRSAELNAGVRRELRGMHRQLSSTVPAWRVVAPEPPEVLLAAYREAEAAFGIPWKYLAAVHLVETGFGRIRGTSTAGARGPMQFLPATWEAYGAGGDIEDTHDAVMGAARYLAANDGAEDIDHALYRYNHSDRYVRGVRTYADLIVEHPRAFLAYYHWGIWYLTDQGEEYLPVGYDEAAPVPVGEYRARAR